MIVKNSYQILFTDTIIDLRYDYEMTKLYTQGTSQLLA